MHCTHNPKTLCPECLHARLVRHRGPTDLAMTLDHIRQCEGLMHQAIAKITARREGGQKRFRDEPELYTALSKLQIRLRFLMADADAIRDKLDEEWKLRDAIGMVQAEAMEDGCEDGKEVQG
jgi:hypothetical protein